MGSDHPTPCVAVVVRHPRDGRVLLLCRHRDDGVYDPWDGHWCLPGGRVEFGEHPERTAFRETNEETGLVAHPGSLRLLPLITSQAAGSRHLVGIIYEAVAWSGDPVNAEPGRHREIGWFPAGGPPQPMMSGAAEVLSFLASGGPGDWP